MTRAPRCRASSAVVDPRADAAPATSTQSPLRRPAWRSWFIATGPARATPAAVAGSRSSGNNQTASAPTAVYSA